MIEGAALPPAAESEAYRGYTQEDMARAARWKDPAPTSTPDFFTDYFGIKTHVSRASWLSGCSGMVQDQPPFPNDHFLAEGIEYAGALLALEAATGPSFAAVEVGAGWGPWTALMGALALRQGRSNIKLTAVEASTKRFALLQRHLTDNGLLPSEDAVQGRVGPVNTKLVNAAGWWRNTSLYFPETDSADDAGMAATPVRRGIDYRGAAVAQARIGAISIPALCRPYPVIDFMHVDIQGGEWELIRHARAFLAPRCASCSSELIAARSRAT